MKLAKPTLFLCILFLIFNCRKEELSNFSPTNNSSTINEDEIILGKKINNPFSTTNMQKASQQISEGNSEAENEIETSHFYVRFLPQNEAELELLKLHTTLELFDYPLDYELEEGGTYYQDPERIGDSLFWQYTVIPFDYEFPNVHHEIIEDLYLPEMGGIEGEESENIDFSYKLIEKAFELTGNKLEKAETNNDNQTEGWWQNLFPNWWTPKGTIKVWDDVKNGYVPVKGAKVRARWFFHISSDYTNSSGYFHTGNFRYSVNYTIKWETTRYDIRSGVSLQAYYNGPNRKGDWNLNIGQGGKSIMYATIHRAAHRYHDGNIGGLQRPYTLRRLKINYMDKVGTGINWGNNWQMFAGGAFVAIGVPIVGVLVASATPNIIISGKKENSAGVVSNRTTDDIFSTTIHEIGHTSHIKTRKLAFFRVTERIRESWANAIEWHITKIEYNELGYPNYDNPKTNPTRNNIIADNMQIWKGSNDSHNYTPLFIDLVDNFNQSLENNGNYLNLPSNRCPNGGGFDGSNCYVGSSPNGTAFIFANSFYYSGTSCLSPGCYFMSIPNNTVGFIWANNWYLRPAGDSRYPYDEVTGYTMPQLEGMLQHFNGTSTTHNKVKLNKPTGMTDENLDLLFNYYYNL